MIELNDPSIKNIFFDWDGCLGDHPNLQKLAKAYANLGFAVYVLTGRNPSIRRFSTAEFQLLASLDIPIEILYAWKNTKHEMMKQRGGGLLYDDDAWEVDQIEQTNDPTCYAVYTANFQSNVSLLSLLPPWNRSK